MELAARRVGTLHVRCVAAPPPAWQGGLVLVGPASALAAPIGISVSADPVEDLAFQVYLVCAWLQVDSLSAAALATASAAVTVRQPRSSGSFAVPSRVRPGGPFTYSANVTVPRHSGVFSLCGWPGGRAALPPSKSLARRAHAICTDAAWRRQRRPRCAAQERP